MELAWLKETSARWDAGKQRIIGEAPPGAFDPSYRTFKPDSLAPGQWWKATAEGQTVGYGWLDVVWGDAEILLATSKARQGHGIGSFILGHLLEEAKAQGLNHLYNLVRPDHPDAVALTQWLTKRGFRAGEGGRFLLAISGRAGKQP